MPSKEQLRVPGVWTFTDAMSAADTVSLATRLESLGYSTLWLPETLGRDPLVHIGMLAAETDRLQFATGIANIFNRHPGAMKQAAHTLAEQTNGRFILGLGVSHAPMVAGVLKVDYSKPLSQMRRYLEAMDKSYYIAPQPTEPATRLLAALGPKMLELAAQQADGAHPYWSTPEHTLRAREILGPDKLLCVEQKVVVSTDATAARDAGRAALSAYAALPNYRNNWKRLGFSEDEIEHREDRFVDAVVAWGDESTVRRRIQDHYDAGADHVCIQALSIAGAPSFDWHAIEALAPG